MLRFPLGRVGWMVALSIILAVTAACSLVDENDNPQAVVSALSAPEREPSTGFTRFRRVADGMIHHLSEIRPYDDGMPPRRRPRGAEPV